MIFLGRPVDIRNDCDPGRGLIGFRGRDSGMKTVSVSRLAALVDGDVLGDADTVISDGRSFERAGREHVTFAQTARNLRKLKDCEAGCVLLARDVEIANYKDWKAASFIRVDDPMPAFLRILAELRPRRQSSASGISPDATISAAAEIGAGTTIHPRAVVCEDVRIGENCEIFPGVYIGAGCILGNDVVLRPNVVIYHDVRIGNRVAIDAGSVIGSDGYGFKLRDGRQERIPHFGTVRIDDDVEIGACTTIDRAMIGETVIGEGTKIDNLVLVAHNCELGRHNLIVGQVGFAGSVTTGEYVVCAGQAGVTDHVHLGSGSIVASKSGVHRDIPEGGTVLGAPAIPITEGRQVLSAQRKLPALLMTVRTLSADVENLKQHVFPFTDAESAADRSAA